MIPILKIIDVAILNCHCKINNGTLKEKRWNVVLCLQNDFLLSGDQIFSAFNKSWYLDTLIQFDHNEHISYWTKRVIFYFKVAQRKWSVQFWIAAFSLIGWHKLASFYLHNNDPYNLHLHGYFSKTCQPEQINNIFYDEKLFRVALMIKLIRIKKPKRCQPIITFEKHNALNLSFSGITFCPGHQTHAHSQSQLKTDLSVWTEPRWTQKPFTACYMWKACYIRPALPLTREKSIP